INLGNEIQLAVNSIHSSVPIASINWQPVSGLSCADCFNVIANPSVSTLYQLTATDYNGCVVTDSVRISVIPTGQVYVPNAFSPNFDGVNDLFEIFPDASVAEVTELRIYDRWGGEVYIFEPGERPSWDGLRNGKPAGEGVYVYQLTVTLLNGTQRSFAGSLILLK
ncbi:MAG: gliding motility-associated C-terminal domain-containing protein, partial [Bacteroidota bacterium]